MMSENVVEFLETCLTAHQELDNTVTIEVMRTILQKHFRLSYLAKKYAGDTFIIVSMIESINYRFCIANPRGRAMLLTGTDILDSVLQRGQGSVRSAQSLVSSKPLLWLACDVDQLSYDTHQDSKKDPKQGWSITAQAHSGNALYQAVSAAGVRLWQQCGYW